MTNTAYITVKTVENCVLVSTVETANASDVKVPQQRVSSQVQVVWDGRKCKPRKQEINLHRER